MVIYQWSPLDLPLTSGLLKKGEGFTKGMGRVYKRRGKCLLKGWEDFTDRGGGFTKGKGRIYCRVGRVY